MEATAMGCLQLEEGDFGQVPEQKTMKRGQEEKPPVNTPAAARGPADYVVYVVCIECGKMCPG
jgi:hypothetical protein